MKLLLSLLLVLFAAFGIAQAEWNTPTTAQSWTDQVAAGGTDTVTFDIKDGTDVLFVEIITSDVATLTCKYRCFQSADDYHLASASSETVSFITTTGTSTTSLTTAADGCYILDIDPRGGEFHQFILSADAELDYRIICKQREQ